MLAQIQNTGVSFFQLVGIVILMMAAVAAIRGAGRGVRWLTSFHRPQGAAPPLPGRTKQTPAWHAARLFAAAALLVCGGLLGAFIAASAPAPGDTGLSRTEPELSAESGPDTTAETRSGRFAPNDVPYTAALRQHAATTDAVATPTDATTVDTNKVADNGSTLLLLLQIPPEFLSALLGNAGADDATHIPSVLPSPLRQTYALIPLTIPGNPMSAAGSSLATADQLRTLARLFTQLLAAAGSPKNPQLAPPADSGAPATNVVELPDETSVELLAAAVADSVTRPLPDWAKKPGGGRIVVETLAPSEDDIHDSLHSAVCEALESHMKPQLQGKIRPEPDWKRLIQLQLSPETFKTCVVAQHDQIYDIPMPSGTQTWRKAYALVEFPEAVDRAAAREIRLAVQQHRMAAVLLVTGVFWIMLLSIGLLVRTGRSRTGLVRLSAGAGLVFISLPLGLLSAALTLAVCRGESIELPWDDGGREVIITALPHDSV